MRRTISAQAPGSLILIMMSSLLFSACHADTEDSSPLGMQEAKYLTAVNEALRCDADAAAKTYLAMGDVQAAQARHTDDSLFNAQWRMAQSAARLAASVKEVADSVTKEGLYRIILNGARRLAADIQDWPVNRLRELLPWKTDLTSA